LKYFHDPNGIALADMIILPGSKQTMDDLDWIEERGFDEALLRHAKKGGLTVGICGGFQMLGNDILDPHGMERAGTRPALGMLPVRTTMARDKITVPARGTLTGGSLFGQGADCEEAQGYEIHLGTTEYLDGSIPFASIVRRGDTSQTLSDGCVSNDRRTFGTYLHGIFDGDAFRHTFLRASRTALRMSRPTELIAWSERRRQQLDLLADAFGNALDLDAVFEIIGLPPRRDRVERSIS